MSTDKFFNDPNEQSIVKSEIVSKYFWAWAKVMISNFKNNPHLTRKIAYIDLFSGPGLYDDGTKSTPIKILEKVIEEKEIKDVLVSSFNDINKDNIESLKNHIEKIPGVDTLAYKPKFMNIEVGEELVKKFESIKLIPTFSFIDPWGYKGLSLKLIFSLIKDFGSDCVIFFNYNRINPGLDNPKVKEHMEALFGSERVNKLKLELSDLDPEERELKIIEEITDTLKQMGGLYILPFRFKGQDGKRTSHYLIFVSKNPLGYKIMKEIMASESTSSVHGIPSFEYIPADKRYTTLAQFCTPFEDLEEMLLGEFAGKTLTMIEIFESHNIGKPFIAKNYKDVLLKMERENKIIAYPPFDKRRKRKGVPTFADVVKVTFPSRSK